MNGDLDMKLIERARDGYLRELGMTISACNINVWTNPKFRLGGPCNPDPGAQARRARRDAEGARDLQGARDRGHERLAGIRRRRLPLPDRLPAGARVVHRVAGHAEPQVPRGRHQARDRAEAVRAARAVHDHPDGGVGHRRRAEGEPGVRRQQLRPHDRLRPSEDGGDDGVDRVRSGGVRRRAGAQVRHQRRAPGPQRSGPDVRDDLDSRVGRVSSTRRSCGTTRAGTARISSRIARTRPARSSAA